MNPAARSRAGLFASALLLGACAGPAPYVLNPAYKDAKLDGRAVLLLPLQDVQIDNEDDFRDDLMDKQAYGDAVPGQQEAVLGRLFFRSLERLADHASPVYDSTLRIKEGALRDTLMDMPGKKAPVQATYEYPPAQLLADRGLTADLGLQLIRLRFSRVEGGTSAPMMMPGPSISTPAGTMPGAPMMMGGGKAASSLQMTGSYLLWDYKANAPVAYGRFSTSSTFQYYMDASDWDKVVRVAVQDIVRNSPLKGKKYAKAIAPPSQHAY